MGRENVENWRVQNCALFCSVCKKPFADKEKLFSRLLFAGREYIRHDLCEVCWGKSTHGLSSWRTTFVDPVDLPQAGMNKESAEALLRTLVARGDDDDTNVIFILAIMLERKKVLIERDVQVLEGKRKLRIYEHKRTNESFMVIDPQLKLDELTEVQVQVSELLGA